MFDQLHFEILSAAQKEVWQALVKHSQQLSAVGFYLAGGTALSLQIGHRYSADFDFFSPQRDTTAQILSWIETLSAWQLRDQDSVTIHGESLGVKISMIGGYKFITVDELVTTLDKVNLASVREIGAMKLLSITHRAVIRDYLDLAVIIRDHAGLDDLLGMATKKYGAKFNRLIPLRALVSFDDVIGEWPALLDGTIRHSWQTILRQAVKEAA